MASKMVKVMKRSEDGCIIKINFEKTYDSVDWDFIDFILSKMGFRSKWIG